MKSRKMLYRSAWKNLRIHYFLNVMIVFLVGYILRDGYQYATDWTNWGTQEQTSIILRENRDTNADVMMEFLRGQELIDIDFSQFSETAAEKYTMGYFSVIINEITASGSLGFGILGGLNKILFDGRIGQSVTIFVMVAVLACYWIFVKNLISIGRCRYFLEQRTYPNVSADRLLFVYRTDTTLRSACTMLLRSLYQTLWNLTIVGGVVKYYEYRLIPYILAENPNIRTKDAFRLSKELMRGDKRRAFWLDVSLLPGVLLDGATFHLSSLFFFNPFRECLFAEFYALVREEKRDGVFRAELLNDDFLMHNSGGLEAYPHDKGPTPYVAHRSWMNTNYEKDYTRLNAVLMFFLFAFVGWLFEVAFYLVNEGSFINRGVLTGPWLPIYSVGGLLILFLLKPVRRNPPLLFGMSFLMCGALEYMTSWVLELLAHKRWWDYTGYFMNLHGRICLEGLTVFGLAGVAVTYCIAPVSDSLLEHIPEKKRRVIAAVLVILFAADCAWSLFHPNTGNGITEGFY